MKTKHVISAAFLSTTLVASATVTLVFNQPFAGGVSSNLAAANGVATNGLFWGVIVDNAGDGVLASYGAVTPVAGARIDLQTSTGLAVDDTLIFSNAFTEDTSAFLEGGTFIPGDDGGISSITNLALSDGVDQDDVFYIVWFDNVDSSKAGIMADASFVLPSEGNDGNYDTPFIGVDPIRPADGSALTFVTVPEPSSFALLGLGGLALFLRRRR